MTPAPREVSFEPYLAHDPACAVAAVTPSDAGFIHTYYDTCPWSPSGRYLACLRLPFEDRQPGPDDRAEVCVIDLQQRTIRAVCETTAWGTQTAAHQAWGRTDRYLYLNLRRGDEAVGMRLELETGESMRFDGPIWAIAPDESYAVSPCQNRSNLTQLGYGLSVHADRQIYNVARAAADDGFYRVDLRTGRKTLLVSLAAIWDALPNQDALRETTLYAFHVKINPQGTRLLLVARALPRQGKYHPMLLTCRPDGSELRCLLSTARWEHGAGAGHPGWHPNGREVLMTIAIGAGKRRFGLINAETGAISALLDEPEGAGHPTITPDERWLVYDRKRTVDGRRLTAIVNVDLKSGTWRELCAVESPEPVEVASRVDGHPAWDRAGRRVCFQGAPDGRRRLFIAAPTEAPGRVPQML